MVDRDDDDPDAAIVVNRPDVPAAEWDVDSEHTVATFPGNEAYPDDAPVVVVAFRDDLTDAYPEYDGERPLPLTELNDQNVPFYTFPEPRLKAAVDTCDDSPDEADTTPEPALLAIAEHLEDKGVAVEYDAGQSVLRAEYLGETYRIQPDGTVEGDGTLRDRLKAAVSEVDR